MNYMYFHIKHNYFEDEPTFVFGEGFKAFAKTIWAEMLGKSHRYTQHLLQHAKHARMHAWHILKLWNLFCSSDIQK